MNTLRDNKNNQYVINHISMIGDVQQDNEETGKYYFDFTCGGVAHTISDYDQAVVIDFQDKMIELVTEYISPTYTMIV